MRGGDHGEAMIAPGTLLDIQRIAPTETRGDGVLIETVSMCAPDGRTWEMRLLLHYDPVIGGFPSVTGSAVAIASPDGPQYVRLFHPKPHDQWIDDTGRHMTMFPNGAIGVIP